MADIEKRSANAGEQATNAITKHDSQDTLTNKLEKSTEEDKKEEKSAGLGDFIVG